MQREYSLFSENEKRWTEKYIQNRIKDITLALHRQYKGKVKDILQRENPPLWKVKDDLFYNCYRYKVSHVIDNKIAGIQGRAWWHLSSMPLNIEERVFVPSWHISFCNTLVLPLIEAIQWINRNHEFTQIQTLYDYWTEIAKLSRNIQALKDTISEMREWTEGEYESMKALGENTGKKRKMVALRV